VRSDYVVEYYETEEKYKAAAKPKGQMRLSGYQVEANPNKFAMEKLAAVFKELHIEEAVPECKDHKPFTIEMYHPTRRCWFIQCADEAEYK
jgi:hypothetical protein